MGETLFGLIGMVVFIAAWIWVAGRLKKKGKGFFLRHIAGFVSAWVASLIFSMVLGIAGLLDTDQGNDTPATASQGPDTRGSNEQSTPNDSISSDIGGVYTVLSDDYRGNIKRTVEVTLDHRITRDQLAEIAQVIKSNQAHETERTFISYRLAEQQGGGMYWATTHYNPNLAIQILGTTIEQQAEIEANDTGPQQFPSVEAMFEEFQDYPPERKENFEQLGNDPVHIRVSADTFKADLDDVIHDTNWRAAIYGVYNTLIHTSNDRVIVDAIPVQYEGLMDRDNPQMLNNRRVTLDMTRQDALKAINKLIQVHSIDDVKEATEYGYQWTGAFQNYYYDNLDAFISALRPYCDGACS